MSKFILVIASLFIFAMGFAADDKALELVRKLEKNSRGETFSGDMNMTITQRGQSRQIAVRVWSRGRDEALIRVLEPARDRGTGNLRIKTNLWQYLPRVNKTIKIPSSMLFQSWMGSDFSNDDLVKSSSLEHDYEHKYIGEEKINDQLAAKIESIPKPDAKIVWGKVILWLLPKEGALIQQDFYTEAGKLIKQLKGSDPKTFGKYTIPTKVSMQDFSRKESLTEVVYSKVEFDKKLSDALFTLKELEKPL